MKNAIITGTGSYLPTKVLSNYDLEEKIETTHEWIYERTGIESRHIADETETTSFMAAQAAKLALEASQIDPNAIDLIIVATCTPDCFFPSTACYVKNALSINRQIPTFDVGAACSGFVYIMDIAKQYIASGAAKNVLLIGSEQMSKAVDWQDRSTCVLFGDGAGAIVLSVGEEEAGNDKQGILATRIHSAYDVESILTFPNILVNPTGKIKMRGNEVFKLAVNMMGDIVDDILADCQLNKSDINWLVPHQANIRIIKAIAKKIDLPMSNVIVTVESQGNTSAASIPIALDYSVRSQKIKRGDLLLIEAFGGGITWGAALIRY